jgi:enoyl-CoA hydratase/carnithine racemase
MNANPALLLVDRTDEHVTVTLNRPEKRNALSVQLRDELSDVLDEFAADPTLKVVVITGSGDVFSAGFDLAEFDRAAQDERFGRQLWASSDRYHETVLHFPLPTLAAVNGPALAGGFDLAVLCDLRIASSRARFAHPERTFGDVVYGPLHDLVGGAVARELTIGGRELSAEEAHAVHLVGEVVEPDALMDAARAAVARIVAAPRTVLVRMKAKALARSGSVRGTATLDL